MLVDRLDTTMKADHSLRTVGGTHEPNSVTAACTKVIATGRNRRASPGAGSKGTAARRRFGVLSYITALVQGQVDLGVVRADVDLDLIRTA